MIFPFEDFDLVEVTNLISQKKVSSFELTQESIHRLKTVGRNLNAVFMIDEDIALTRAKTLDEFQMKNNKLDLLHGVPLAHKDLISVENRTSHLGSKFLSQRITKNHCDVNALLQNAGQVNVASLHMAEFALSPTGFNQHYGHGKNPWNSEYVSGGSSSGSGIAVAARLIFGSIGSDTGGSIRHPASMCGVTGLKPTNQLVSVNGVFPLSSSLDCVGPIAQSVQDCARLLTVITGQKINYELTLNNPIKGKKIAILKDYFYENLDPAVEIVMNSVVQTFQNLGVEFAEVKTPNMQRINENMGNLLAYESLEIHRDWLNQYPSEYANQVRARIERGHQVTLEVYRDALLNSSLFRKLFQLNCFKDFDALLLPTIQIQTPSIQSTVEGSIQDVLNKVSRLTQVTKSWNYLGFPALSLPGGFGSNGLPIGFQLIGDIFKEEGILNLGYRYQLETDWHKKNPKNVDKLSV